MTNGLSAINRESAAGDISRPSAQGLFVRAVFERTCMVLPLEVGYAADFGLTQAAHALQIAVSMAAASAFSEKPASARRLLKSSGEPGLCAMVRKADADKLSSRAIASMSCGLKQAGSDVQDRLARNRLRRCLNRRGYVCRLANQA